MMLYSILVSYCVSKLQQFEFNKYFLKIENKFLRKRKKQEKKNISWQSFEFKLFTNLKKLNFVPSLYSWNNPSEQFNSTSNFFFFAIQFFFFLFCPLSHMYLNNDAVNWIFVEWLCVAVPRNAPPINSASLAMHRMQCRTFATPRTNSCSSW